MTPRAPKPRPGLTHGIDPLGAWRQGGRIDWAQGRREASRTFDLEGEASGLELVVELLPRFSFPASCTPLGKM